MAKLYFYTFLIGFLFSNVNAQICPLIPHQYSHTIPQDNGFNFSNQNQLLSDVDRSTELIVAIADMNGDKLDDIIRLDNGRTLHIEYQTIEGEFFTYTFGDVSSSGQWSLTIADVDDNGFKDIILGGLFDGLKLLLASDDGSFYTSSILPASADFFAQGSNFIDINEDGLVDVFVCSDESESKIWENTGDGNFQAADDWIDMATIPVSDNSGNYASVWTDFDNDQDLDLYISKCRTDVESSDDPRRINQLFVNDGNNNFSEMAETYGLKNGGQTWTSDFQDIDNDGDLDCFLVQHFEPCQLLINDGTGHFSDGTASSGLNITTNYLQGILRDFNNDGFVDILLAGTQGYQFFENNGNGTFIEIEDLFGNYLMGTFAIGDLNHDGFIDVYAGSPTNDDVLWMNDKNDQNYLAVNLEATNSHSNAIGTRLMLYGEWGVQIREVRAGESYGIANSFTQYFGIGAFGAIDSLCVLWPSGTIEKFENPAINQFLNIIENDCAFPDCFISSEEGLILCSGDTITLNAPIGNSYNWSTGANTSSIEIVEGGSYTVTVTNAYGCTAISNPVFIEQDPIETLPQITVLGPMTFCEGGNTILSSSTADQYEWSTGQTSKNIVIFNSGEYFVTTPGICNDVTSESVEIVVIPKPETPMVENDTIAEVPGMGVLTATGANVFWYATPNGGNSLGSGNSFQSPQISETTSYYAQDITVAGNLECKSNREEALVVFDSTTQIIELSEQTLFSVFPNPADDFIVLKKESIDDKTFSIQLINAAGQTIFKKSDVLDQEIFINTSTFINGFYLLNIQSGEDIFYKKMIIQKR